VHLRAQRRAARGPRGIGRDVAHAVGVRAEVVELDRGALAETQVPEGVRPRAAARLEDEGLGRARVDVQVTRLRVARRPARGLEVLQIEHARLDQPADRIADVVRPADVVALHPDEGEVPARHDLAGAVAAEDRREADARELGHAGAFAAEARHLEEGGREVHEAHVVVDHPPAPGDAGGPADRQRDVVRERVCGALTARERHPVVGGHDNEGIFRRAAPTRRASGRDGGRSARPRRRSRACRCGSCRCRASSAARGQCP